MVGNLPPRVQTFLQAAPLIDKDICSRAKAEHLEFFREKGNFFAKCWVISTHNPKGHQLSKIWSLTFSKMITQFKKEGRQPSPWWSNTIPIMVIHQHKNGQLPFPGWLTLFPGRSPTISRMVNQTWSLTLGQHSLFSSLLCVLLWPPLCVSPSPYWHFSPPPPHCISLGAGAPLGLANVMGQGSQVTCKTQKVSKYN